MIISSRRHRLEMEELGGKLRASEWRVTDLEQRLSQVERSRHEFVEQMRYVLEAGGEALEEVDTLRGENLKRLGHVLPYLLTGRRHWDEAGVEDAGRVVLEARKLAAQQGFALPAEPASGVLAMLDVAITLFNPSRSDPVERLKDRYKSPMQ